MPRGMNPNSQANLKKPEDFTPKELRERAKKGAEASAKARRRLKSFRELDDEQTTDDERIEMLDALKLKAKRGNLRAFEIYRDTMGMKPKDADEHTEYEDDGFTEAIKRSAGEVWK